MEINAQQLTAAEFVDIDASIPPFNEWEDEEHLKGIIELSQGDDNEDEAEDLSSGEKVPNIHEVLEMVRRIHLFTMTEQPQLHDALYDLKSQLTDVYLVSKATKQSFIRDLFFDI